MCSLAELTRVPHSWPESQVAARNAASGWADCCDTEPRPAIANSGTQPRFFARPILPFLVGAVIHFVGARQLLKADGGRLLGRLRLFGGRRFVGRRLHTCRRARPRQRRRMLPCEKFAADFLRTVVQLFGIARFGGGRRPPSTQRHEGRARDERLHVLQVEQRGVVVAMLAVRGGAGEQRAAEAQPLPSGSSVPDQAVSASGAASARFSRRLKNLARS